MTRTPRDNAPRALLTRVSWAMILGGVLVLGAPLRGHHSFAEYYLEGETIEIEGDIVQFQFKNPHSWIYVQGQEGLSAPRTYAAEWAGTSRLEREGIAKNTLRPGDAVRIWASPNRNPSDTRIRLKRIERRSDGWKWAGGQRERR